MPSAQKLSDWDVLCREPKSKSRPPAGKQTRRQDCDVKNQKFCQETFLNAESGGPPLKEYKQSRAEHSKSSSWPHKKKKFRKSFNIITEIQNSTGNRLQSSNIIRTNQRPRAGNRTENWKPHLCSLNLSREPISQVEVSPGSEVLN